LDELGKSNPSNTILKVYLFPTINAGTELDASNPGQAIA